MDKKLKTSLPIVLSGYIFSLGFYFIWCFYFFYEKLFKYDYFLVIITVVFSITAVYLFSLLLISFIKFFQNVWSSFSLVSIITLLIFFLIPYINNLIYHKLNLRGYKTVQTTEKNGRESETPVTNNIKTDKHHKGSIEKLQTERKRMKESESKLNKSLLVNDIANTSIAELKAKLESERKENDNLRKKLNETIRNIKSKDEVILTLRSKLKEMSKAADGVIVNGKSNKDTPGINIKSKVDDTDLDSIGQEIIFRVQIISSDTLLPINSPKLKGLKNLWEYEDGGLHKYTVGNEKDFKSASVLQSELRRMGFVDAFVAAFKNGKRIPIRKARKLLN